MDFCQTLRCVGCGLVYLNSLFSFRAAHMSLSRLMNYKINNQIRLCVCLGRLNGSERDRILSERYSGRHISVHQNAAYNGVSRRWQNDESKWILRVDCHFASRSDWINIIFVSWRVTHSTHTHQATLMRNWIVHIIVLGDKNIELNSAVFHKAYLRRWRQATNELCWFHSGCLGIRNKLCFEQITSCESGIWHWFRWDFVFISSSNPQRNWFHCNIWRGKNYSSTSALSREEHTTYERTVH